MEPKFHDLYRRSRPSAELVRRTQTRLAREKRGRTQMKWVKGLAAAAAVVLVFGASVNLSPAFAQAVDDIPVVGSLARVLTVRSFTQEQPDSTVTVEQPMVADDTAFAADVNERINAIVDEYLDEANARIEEHRQAFLATGGTEEEFERMNIQVSVDYEILSETEDRVSFVLRAAQSDDPAGTEEIYYNLDLATGKELTLADVLGTSWAERCNAAIEEQMAERTDVPYFSADAGGFATVDENTSFYIDENGTVVVVLPKYAVAPGAYGPQEFPID